MRRYSKALAALASGIVSAAALVPTDAPVWLLALVAAAQPLAVYAAPRNASPFQSTTTRRPRERAY